MNDEREHFHGGGKSADHAPDESGGVARGGRLVIRTPEGVTFAYDLAGPAIRFFALIIDMAAIAVAVNTLILLALIFSTFGFSVFMAIQYLIVFIIPVGYAMALEWGWRGQTLGKRVMRLRVMDERGMRLRFSQVALRNLLRFVDYLPAFYALGGLACLISPKSQRLGDFAAGTVVIRIPKIGEPDLDQIMGGRYNSFRDHPHIAARLRQNVVPEEAALAWQAVARRDRFDPDARVELFRDLADYFRQKADFPDEVTEGLSDENYVRNVMDIVFRAQN